MKIEIGAAREPQEQRTADVAGRDQLTGLLKRIPLTSEEVQLALEGPVTRIVEAVKETLERTPPELSADVVTRGIVIVGGGSLLEGLDARLHAETHLPIHTVESPLTCVAIGAGRSLEELDAIARAARRP